MNYTGLSRAIRQPWFMNIEKEIFKRAKQNHDVLSAWSSQYWYEATFPFLASMTPGVLLELVEGNLAEEQLRNLDPDQPLHRPPVLRMGSRSWPAIKPVQETSKFE